MMMIFIGQGFEEVVMRSVSSTKQIRNAVLNGTIRKDLLINYT